MSSPVGGAIDVSNLSIETSESLSLIHAALHPQDDRLYWKLFRVEWSDLAMSISHYVITDVPEAVTRVDAMTSAFMRSSALPAVSHFAYYLKRSMVLAIAEGLFVIIPGFFQLRNSLKMHNELVNTPAGRLQLLKITPYYRFLIGQPQNNSALLAHPRDELLPLASCILNKFTNVRWLKESSIVCQQPEKLKKEFLFYKYQDSI